MGETTDGGLYEIFQQDYGPVGSPSFEAARENFIISSAGYAVASLLLQPKDRHNGNLLFDKYDLSPSFPLILLLVNILNDFENFKLSISPFPPNSSFGQTKNISL